MTSRELRIDVARALGPRACNVAYDRSQRPTGADTLGRTAAAPILHTMDDFRTQLTAVIDHMMGEGDTPIFLVVDLYGALDIKRTRGADSLEEFKTQAIGLVSSLTNGCDAFTYGDETLVAMLSANAFDRLKTFALIQKLRRAVPLLGQSFDCYLRPECDVLEYEAQTGAAGLISQIAKRRQQLHERLQEDRAS